MEGGVEEQSCTQVVVVVDFISFCTELYICAKQVGYDSCLYPAVTSQRFAATQHFTTISTAATAATGAHHWGPRTKCVTNHT